MFLKTFVGKLTYGKQCDNITIRKGVTDRRFAPHSLVKKVTAQFGTGRLFFCAFIFTECVSGTKACQAEAQYAK